MFLAGLDSARLGPLAPARGQHASIELSRSWASIDYEPGVDLYHVDQLGPRRLWDEVEAACRWWLHAGSPKAEQWKFTITPEGQRIELAS